MTIFGMVTTRHSHRYTNYAIPSLIENTKFQPGDEVILIDNDADYPGLPNECSGKVRVVVNEKPRSFAANLNQTIDLAGERGADVMFLNNDLIFSRGWYESLRDVSGALASPVSNAEIPYDEGDLHCKLFMELEDYLGKEHLFREIVRKHRNRARGYVKVLTFPFFAVKIPHRVYSVVGRLDESFGIGGGEDKDYAIRCHLEGFELRFALNSYILHFQGKSTWRGAESSEQTAARDDFYRQRFKGKWGSALFDLLVMHEESRLPPELRRVHDEGDFQNLIKRLLPPQ